MLLRQKRRGAQIDMNNQATPQEMKFKYLDIKIFRCADTEKEMNKQVLRVMRLEKCMAKDPYRN